jgi:hypothetical protein
MPHANHADPNRNADGGGPTPSQSAYWPFPTVFAARFHPLERCRPTLRTLTEGFKPSVGVFAGPFQPSQITPTTSGSGLL